MFQFPPFALACWSMTSSELPHSEIPGSQLVSSSPRLIAAFPRPSSPPSAKASTVCSFQLDHRHEHTQDDITSSAKRTFPLLGTCDVSLARYKHFAS